MKRKVCILRYKQQLKSSDTSMRLSVPITNLVEHIQELLKWSSNERIEWTTPSFSCTFQALRKESVVIKIIWFPVCNSLLQMSSWKLAKVFSNRIWKVLTMLYNTQNYRSSGLCPSSGIQNDREHNVSETGCVSVLRWLRLALSKGPNPHGLRLVLSKGLNCVVIPPHLRTERDPVYESLCF
jgi:hypothetical protein